MKLNRVLTPVAVLVCLVGLSGCPGTACLGIDTCQLEGVWQTAPTEKAVTQTVEIADNTIKWTGSLAGFSLPGIPFAGGFSGTFEIDPWKRPKEMNITINRVFLGGDTNIGVEVSPGRLVMGIYKVSRRELVVRLGTDELRPDAFDTEETVTLTRVDL